jgi:lipopolysaccharide transport system ATP-binding protein
VAALTDVNLRFEDGDRVGVVGPNGAGKSTLLRTLAKVYEPTKGNAHIDGKVISLIDLALGINPEASGSENLFIRGRLLGLTRKEIFKKHDDIVAFSELGEYMHMPVRTYSSGMLLRLAFSVSTAVNPEILLMDEWLSVGDADFRGKAEARLSGLVAKTRILVIASHSRELIEQVCNRAIWVEHGAVKMDGPVQSVCDAYFG